MPKIAGTETEHDTPAAGRNLAKFAKEANEPGADAARESAEAARTTAGAVAEGQRDAARQSAEGTAEAGRAFVQVLSEQTQHSMQAATALARAVNWAEFAQIQRAFIGGSFERMSRLGDSYRGLFTSGLKPAAFTSRH